MAFVSMSRVQLLVLFAFILLVDGKSSRKNSYQSFGKHRFSPQQQQQQQHHNQHQHYNPHNPHNNNPIQPSFQHPISELPNHPALPAELLGHAELEESGDRKLCNTEPQHSVDEITSNIRKSRKETVFSSVYFAYILHALADPAFPTAANSNQAQPRHGKEVRATIDIKQHFTIVPAILFQIHQ
jgi:hypothetical protein